MRRRFAHGHAREKKLVAVGATGTNQSPDLHSDRDAYADRDADRVTAATVLVIRPSRHGDQSRAIEYAVRIAKARDRQLTLVGIPGRRPWYEWWAPLSGGVTLDQLLTGAEADVERHLRDCVNGLPDSLGVRFLQCAGWRDGSLIEQLSRLNAPTVIVTRDSLRGPRRKAMRTILHRLEGELLLVGSGAAEVREPATPWRSTCGGRTTGAA